jgi:hypothetical protein
MNIDEMMAAIEGTPKGANIKVTIERPVRLLTAYKDLPMFKRTKMTVRIGIPNDNRKATQEAREAGDRPVVNAGIARMGLEWELFPLLLKAIKNPNQYYLRMEPSSNAKEHCKPAFVICEAGIETNIKKEDYEHMMRSDEKSNGRSFDEPFNVKIESVMQLGEFYAAKENENELEDETI